MGSLGCITWIHKLFPKGSQNPYIYKHSPLGSLLKTKHTKKFRLKITIIMISIHGQKNFRNKKITQIWNPNKNYINITIETILNTKW